MFKRLLFLLLLVSAIFLIYAPGIHGPFIFDDLPNILHNSLLRIQTLDYSSLTSSATSGSAGPLKRPVAMLSFALNYYFASGFEALAFKISNVIIHSLCAILFFILCIQLRKLSALCKQEIAPPSQTFYLAAAACLLWAVHPINLTSVLYVVQRMTSLSALFSLGCLSTYIAARNNLIKHNLTSRNAGLLLGSLSCLILALYSKENAALVPLIIIWLELTLFPNSSLLTRFSELPQSTRRVIYTSIAILFTLVLFVLINYASNGYASRPFNIQERTLTELRVVSFYLLLILIPRIDAFGLFHDDIALSTSLITPWSTLSSAIFLLVLMSTVFVFKKKNPLYAFGLGWFFIGHLLESSFFPLEIAHEHRNYFPFIGLMLAITALIPDKYAQNKKFFSAAFILVLILGATTYLRAVQWGNYQRLAYFEAEHHPDSPAIQALLSNAAFQKGDFETATTAINKAMILSPDETAFSLHYQNILAISKKTIPHQVQQDTLKKIRNNIVSPSTELALDQISGCLIKPICKPLIKNYIEWLDELIKKKPKQSYFHYLIGKAHRASSNYALALNSFQRSHELDKQYLHPLFEMAGIFLSLGQLDQVELIIGWIEEKNKASEFRRPKELKRLKTMLENAKQQASDNPLPPT